MDCLRCKIEMRSLGTQKFQLGQATVLSGVWSNIAAGALEAEILLCPRCGKMEFFAVRQNTQSDLVQVSCPKCGSLHDFDDAKCPVCGARLL